MQDDKEANKLDAYSTSQINASQAEPEPPGGREGPENQQDTEFSLAAGTKLKSKSTSGQGHGFSDTEGLCCVLYVKAPNLRGP